MARPILRLKEGDHRRLRIGVRSANGAPRNLANETIEFRAAPRLGSGNLAMHKIDGDGIEVIDAERGLVELLFEPQDTEGAPPTLLWDVRITDIDGEVITLDWGSGEIPETYGVLLIERAMAAAA